jgi:predicted nucleic acid-binding protein
VAQVIDASIAVAWCVHTQATHLSDAALTAVIESGGHVPAQFWFEVLHSLIRSEQRGLVSRSNVDEFITQLAEHALTIDRAYDATEIIKLYRMARQYRLKVYDAAYLELALRMGVPLATRDAALAQAARAAGVELLRPT